MLSQEIELFQIHVHTFINPIKASEDKTLIDPIEGQRFHTELSSAETLEPLGAPPGALFKVKASVQGPMHLLSKYLRRSGKLASVLLYNVGPPNVMFVGLSKPQ